MAPTDSEKGHVPGQGLPGEGQLEVVPLPDDLAEAGVGGLAIESGVDVGAAREDESIDPVQELGGVLRPAGSQENRQASRLLDISYHTLDAYLRYGSTRSRPPGKRVPAWAPLSDRRPTSTAAVEQAAWDNPRDSQ